MRIVQQIAIVFLIIFISDFAAAQQLRENEIVVIKGDKFVLHQVRTGETIYSITKRFNVDREILLENNPDAAEGLKIGDILKIPYREGANLEEQPVYQKGDPSGFKTHKIKSRTETPYFIAKEYGVTVEELYAYNPQVRRYKPGIEIRIPLWDAPAEKVTEKIEPIEPDVEKEPVAEQKEEDDKLISHKVRSGETLYSIARRYNVSTSEILFYNPGARNLKAGDILYLPAEDKPEIQPEELTEEVTDSKFFEHIIESGETIWGITRKYDVTESELKSLNPVLRSGFPAGVRIKIPVKEEKPVEAKPINEDAFLTHVVGEDETLYGLASKYNLTIPEIKRFNPVLEKRNLVQGEKLLIPRKTDREIVEFMQEKETVDSIPDNEPDYYDVEIPVEIPESCKPVRGTVFSETVYDVALFLPLYLEANDTLNRNTEEMESMVDSFEISLNRDEDELITETDTIIEEEESEDLFFNFYGNSENFVQFYEGVLIAVDSMQRAGMQVRLNVYDTHNNKDSIRNIIYNEDFLETDLIIGPIYPDVQEEVAAIAAKNRIPMVSPLSSHSREIGINPYYYQVNPGRDYIANQTAELIADEYFNSNFIIFKTNNYEGTKQERVVNLIQEKLYNSGFMGQQNGVSFNIYDFQNEGPFGFRRILSHEKENVVYIPSSSEGELSVAISNINNLADKYSITLIGTNRFQDYESIEIEHFHNLKLEYISPYWIDYDENATVRFLEKFRKNFHTDPNNFGAQGYDVAFYFLNALYNYGRDFNDCLPYLQVDLVQGDYQFEKVSSFGGYMNEGVSVVSYRPDFDVVQKRVIGRFRFAQK
ncbi:MAG: PBP1 and LysM peptidoglycan-binding domain-containing protein [Prolixibacteraceae bacterium]